MKVALYTCTLGGIDEVQPMPTGELFDSWLFTDDMAAIFETALADNVKVDGCIAAPMNARRDAKYMKLFPWKVLPENYDVSIWVDGSAVIPDGDALVSMALEHLPLGLWAHPDRDDLEDEVIASRGLSKYDWMPLEEQVASYRLAPHSGLWATGMIARDHRHPGMRSLMQFWWEEIEKWSLQDQLSLPYVLHQASVTPSTFPGNQWENEWISWTPHLHER